MVHPFFYTHQLMDRNRSNGLKYKTSAPMQKFHPRATASRDGLVCNDVFISGLLELDGTMRSIRRHLFIRFWVRRNGGRIRWRRFVS